MKKILFIVFSIAIMSCMLAGCEEKESNTYKDESDTQQSAALININNILSYDNSTRIVYWYFEDGAGRTSTGFMSPYISKDGRYSVCDEVGELADDWYIEDIENEEAYKKCEEDINDLVVKFIEENGMKPTFSKVTDIKPYFVK